MSPKNDGKTRTLINTGRSVYVTDSGRLEPSKTLDVTEEEYKRLIGYEDIKDAETYVRPRQENERLREENAELKKQLKELEKLTMSDDQKKAVVVLQKDNDKLADDNKELQKLVVELKKENDDLHDQIAAAKKGGKK